MTPEPTRPLPFDRTHLTGLASFAWDKFTSRWLLLTVAAYLQTSLALIFAVMVPIPALLFTLPFVRLNSEPGTAAMLASLVGWAVGGLFFLTLTGVLLMGFARIAHGVLHGGPAHLGMLFGQFHKTGKFLRQLAVLVVLVALPLEVAVAAGLLSTDLLHGPITNGDAVVFLGSGLLLSTATYLLLAFAPIELALNDQANPWEAIRTAWNLWSGQRLQAVLYAAFSVLVLLAGLLLCGLPVIAAFGFVQVLYVGLYSALRQEPIQPDPAAGTSTPMVSAPQ